MKKLICLILSIIAVMPLVGCGLSEAEIQEMEFERATRDLERAQANIDRVEREIAELEELKKNLDKKWYGY